MAGPELADDDRHTDPSRSDPPFSEYSGLSVTLVLGFLAVSIIWAAEVPRVLGWPVLPEQLAALCLALALMLVFVAGQRDAPVRWHDVGVAAVGAGTLGYLVWVFPGLVEDLYYRRHEATAIGLILLAVIFHAMRRTIGMGFLILVATAIAYAAFGNWIPEPMRALDTSWQMLIGYLVLAPNSMIGRPLIIVTSIVVPFVIFGRIFSAGGGAAFMTDLATALTGRTRGGPAKVAVLSSAMFGSISGSVVSNVMSTGVFTIPTMRHAGFPARTAAAIEAVASTGGQLMPPVMGAAAFFMADFLGTSYTQVITAALVPAILYYFALLVQADLYGARRGIDVTPAADRPNALVVLRQGAHFMLPLAVIVACLVYFNRSPQWAALAGSCVLIVVASTVGYRGARLSPARLFDAAIAAVIQSLPIVVLGAAAGVLLSALDASGLIFGFGLWLADVGADYLPVLLVVTAAVCILLGMGLPTSAVYILLATLIAPELVALGVPPIAAHLFVLYFGMMSMITPPIAFGAFAAATLAKTDFLQTAWTAMRFGWAAFMLPFVFVYTPELLLEGNIVDIAFVVVCTVAGILMISAAFAGYLWVRLGSIRRVVLVAAGLLALYPDFSSTQGVVISLIGVSIGGAAIAYERWGLWRHGAG